MRTKANLSEILETKPLNPFVNALLADNSIALLAGTLAQIEKQFETHFLTLSLSDFKHNPEIIHTQHRKQMYNKKRKTMNIPFNIHIQETNTTP
jgi:hypothetical protein